MIKEYFPRNIKEWNGWKGRPQKSEDRLDIRRKIK